VTEPAATDRARAVPIESEIARRGIKLRRQGVEFVGPCPVCGDGDDRFSINTTKQVFNCRRCGKGGDVIDLVQHLDGSDFPTARDKLAGEPAQTKLKSNGHTASAQPKLTRWVYKREDGTPYLGVTRFDLADGKTFRQSRWNGNGWEPGKPAGPKIPYRLPELVAAPGQPVFICEGEKCADAVAKLGWLATTASEGAGKWTPDLNKWFVDRAAHILPDNDEPGFRQANLVASNLLGVAREVRIVKLEGLADGEDVFDWIAREPFPENLLRIAEDAPLWQPGEEERDDKGPLRTISAAEFEGKPVPLRQWIVPGLIPDRNVTLLAGDGGTGKSLLALQLAVSGALNNSEIKWIGQPVTGGGALYLSAEDETDELHRRLFDINADYGCRFADLENLQILPLAGEDAVLAAPADRSDIVRATPLWQQLIRLVKERQRKLVILDTLADLFAGNENSRPQARQFISMLRGVALKYDLAFVVVAHPSLTGMAAGTGSSGSTGWNNSVRSRLYLNRVLTEIQGEKGKPIETDPDLRTLITTKTNYGRKGDEIRLRWSNGVFVALDQAASGAIASLTKEAVANEAFMRLLRLHEAQGIDVNPKAGPNYAPKVFANHSQSEGFSRHAFKNAMERLLHSRKIEVEKIGPPSRKTLRLTISLATADDEK
jgi:RecA-family ATPase